MHPRGRLMAINQGNDVWMKQAAQDGDFGSEVVLELLVQLAHIDRLDGNGLTLFLCSKRG